MGIESIADLSKEELRKLSASTGLTVAELLASANDTREYPDVSEPTPHMADKMQSSAGGAVIE